MKSTNTFVWGPSRIIALVITTSGLAISTSAQSQYSVNALGYADINLASGSNLVANPFSASDNSVSNLFREVPDGTFFLPWNGPMGNFSPTNLFTQAGGWTDPGMTLLTPNGGFLWVPSPMRLSFVGEVWQGLGCVQYPAGMAVLSDLRGCQILCDNIVGPCPGDIAADGTMVLKWDGRTQSYQVCEYFDGLGWLPYEPVLAPGYAVQVYVPIPFSVRGLAGGTGVPPREVRANDWRRDAGALTFRVPATNSVSYAVLRCFDLASNAWELVQHQTTSPTGGFARVSIPDDTNRMAFYRLASPFPTSAASLFNPSRGTNTFQCQFYAPVAGQYELQRTLAFGDSSGASWQTVTTVTAAASNVVTVTDTSAIGPRGYYRLSY